MCSTNIRVLGKRSPETLEAILFCIEHDKKINVVQKEHYAAALFLDFNKLERHQQDRFAALMQKGTPDERARIAGLMRTK